MKHTLTHPAFLSELFAEKAKEQAMRSKLHSPLFDPQLDLSKRLEESLIQEASSVRALLLARELSDYLMEGKVEEVIPLLQSGLYPLGEKRHLDAQNRFHLLNTLFQLQDNALGKRIKQLTNPYDNPLADSLIRKTLGLSEGALVGSKEKMRAVLVALMTPLRQNVGSCFATAPAILIQQEQPFRLLEDLEELMGKGSLGRVIGGVEARIPLSPSWGSGDLLRPFLLSAHLEHLAKSPGLWRALEVGGVLESSLFFREKEALCVSLLSEVSKRTPIATPELVIRSCVPKERLREALDAFKGLTDCALLKSWEFTLASFAEIKTSFAKWNLYASLGLHPEEKGGIGEQVQSVLQERLDRQNRELDKLQVEYDSAFSHAKYLEARLARAPEEEAKWLRLEYRRRVGELDQLVAERDRIHQKGQKIARLLPNLVESYSRLFPLYFQEVYDPEIREEAAFLYEDAPAGFRLLYKHGRVAPSVWTLVEGADGFIQALSDFFILSEQRLREDETFKGLETLLSELVGVIVRHVRTDAFLESALFRMAAAHRGKIPKEPLKHLDQVEKKPWAYLSGGTMRELVSGYYESKELPKTRERRVESVEDLLLFLLDAMKELPPKTTNLFLDNPMRSLLIQSPTHAFLFKPGLAPFREGWLDSGNTSTWIRDTVLSPAEDMLSSLWLDRPMIGVLLEALSTHLPPQWRGDLVALTGNRERMRPYDFRTHLLERINKDKMFKSIPELASGEWIDALLYSSLPFCPTGQLKGRIKEIFGSEVKGFDDHFSPSAAPPLLSAYQFHNICLSCAILEGGSAFAAEDIPWKMRTLAAQKGYALPLPLLFADTNWSGELFGFVVNPGDGELALWRTDYLGLAATPMTRWKSSLDGSSPHPWAIYVNPEEFT